MRLIIPVFLLAAASLPAATIAHDYNLTSSLNDLVGSDNLTSDGGTITSSGYSFAADQGLDLSSALTNDGDYSILADFSFQNVTGYRKIVDFENLSSDAGLYNLNGNLNFYPVATGPAVVFTPNVAERVVLTRDGTSGVVTGYVDGVSQFTFSDASSIAVFSATNEIMRFFEDDTATGGRESTAGLATRISIYNGALNATQVAALGGPSLPVGGGTTTPEPASMFLLGAGLVGLAGARHRRNG